MFCLFVSFGFVLLFMHDCWVNEIVALGVGVWISVFQFLGKMGVVQFVLKCTTRISLVNEPTIDGV